jgi:hypothetical protein
MISLTKGGTDGKRMFGILGPLLFSPPSMLGIFLTPSIPVLLVFRSAGVERPWIVLVSFSLIAFSLSAQSAPHPPFYH